MAYLNTIMLMGNVGYNPEYRNLPGGTEIANFSLATTKRYTTSTGEKKEQTVWHRISVAGKAVAIIKKYVRKGTPLFIEGESINSSYTNKQGEQVSYNEVRAFKVQLIGGISQDEQAQNYQEGSRVEERNADWLEDDDMPC